MYSNQIKIAAVKDYENNTKLKDIQEIYGIKAASTILLWSNQIKLYGED